MALRSLFFAAGFAVLAACTAIPADGADNAGMDNSSRIAAGQAFTLRAGQQATLADGGTVRYARLVNDSRCPPGKQCVWAGDAILAFEWTPTSGTAQSFELHTGLEPRSHAIGDRTLVLSSLTQDAEPVATLKVQPAG